MCGFDGYSKEDAELQVGLQDALSKASLSREGSG